MRSNLEMSGLRIPTKSTALTVVLSQLFSDFKVSFLFSLRSTGCDSGVRSLTDYAVETFDLIQHLNRLDYWRPSLGSGEESLPLLFNILMSTIMRDPSYWKEKSNSVLSIQHQNKAPFTLRIFDHLQRKG